MNNKRKILSICIDALFLAIIILMAYTPIGFIPLGVISITIIHVPVLIGAYLFGRKKGALYGLFFGLVSLMKSLQAASSILDPYFQNPLISVLPRLIFGYVSGLTFDLIKRFFKKEYIKQPLLVVASFLMTLLHSVMVLGMLGLLNASKLNSELSGYYASFWAFMGITLTTSSMLEGLAAAIINPTVSFPLSHYVLKRYIAVLEKKPTKKEKHD